MNLVCAALGDDIKLPRRRVSVFRRELIGQQIEFLNGIRDHRDGRARNVETVVVDTVDGEAILSRPVSTDGTALSENAAALSAAAAPEGPPPTIMTSADGAAAGAGGAGRGALGCGSAAGLAFLALAPAVLFSFRGLSSFATGTLPLI